MTSRKGGLWHATGWLVVGRRRIIRYTMHLPASISCTVDWHEGMKRWRFWTGSISNVRARRTFATAFAAMKACEEQLARELRVAQRMLQDGRS